MERIALATIVTILVLMIVGTFWLGPLVDLNTGTEGLIDMISQLENAQAGAVAKYAVATFCSMIAFYLLFDYLLKDGETEVVA